MNILYLIEKAFIALYHLAVDMGESKFAILRMDSADMGYLIFSVVFISALGVLTIDAFQWDDPFSVFTDWKHNINIANVVIYSAAVFSLYSFYKMMEIVLANYYELAGPLLQLDIAGTYFNPFSILIFGVTIATVKFKSPGRQSFFLALVTFASPAILLAGAFSELKAEMWFLIFALGFAVLTLIIRGKLTSFSTVFAYDVYWIIIKYFLLRRPSGLGPKRFLLDTSDLALSIKQYLNCVHLDLILCVVLLLVLFGYERLLDEDAKGGWKIDLVCLLFFGGLTAASFLFVKSTPVEGASAAVFNYFATYEEVEVAAAPEEIRGVIDLSCAHEACEDWGLKTFTRLGFDDARILRDAYGLYGEEDSFAYSLVRMRATTDAPAAMAVYKIPEGYSYLVGAFAPAPADLTLADFTLAAGYNYDAELVYSEFVQASVLENWGEGTVGVFSVWNMENGQVLYRETIDAATDPALFIIPLLESKVVGIRFETENGQGTASLLGYHWQILTQEAYNQMDYSWLLETSVNRSEVMEAAGVYNPVGAFEMTAGSGNIRAGAGKSNPVVHTGHKGDIFYGTGASEDVDGTIWYEIYLEEGSDQTGWASSKVIKQIE